jgi:hypothetical protein
MVIRGETRARSVGLDHEVIEDVRWKTWIAHTRECGPSLCPDFLIGCETAKPLDDLKGCHRLGSCVPEK